MFLLVRVLLLSVLLLLGSTTAKEYDYELDVSNLFQKRQILQSSIVTGLPLVNGTIPLRREIRDLENDHEAFTLYILALSWMQYTDQTDDFSWYRIAGIHGAPYTDYGGVTALPNNTHEGFCTHVSPLFPAWHRPYLALFEFIASLYPEGPQQDLFTQAALNFRMPYWDWAVTPPNGTSVLPLSVGGSPDVEVDGPNGRQRIGNPLFSYTFKPLNASSFPEYPFNHWNETKRAPRPISSVNPVSNNSLVAKTLDSQLPSNQQRLYNLFSNYDNYSTWSNEGWIPYGNNGTYDSIESLHDTIHLACGGNYGNMAIIAYSSFDPVFFLHHTSVDRIFAMWQTIHNESWIEPTPAILATRTISVDQIQDSQTELTPFFHNETHLWNSDMVRDHKIFGYTYAETASGSRSDVIAAINRLYTTYSPARMLATRNKRQDGEISKDGVHQTPETSRGAGTEGPTWDTQGSSTPNEQIVQDGKYREWIANIHVNKHALNRSFSINIFFGEVPGDLSTWQITGSLVGTMGIFAHSGSNSNMAPNQIAGTIPLTAALMNLVDTGELRSLDLEAVEPFLRQYLRIGIAINDGSVIDAKDVDGLGISVVSSQVNMPQDIGELASWGVTVPRFDIYS
ncbi:tyrosinase precursor [Pseudomassariella vexata]|uniref:Tyrosinase n=1 Tax=Pseudomassariella vexata TaxID=1141098 RepID=A0A1Y2E320_9PEZI|nr:tyrosinase precursor [Pseudomassariella vexata]ORY65943.1 tyrosinase precursor [Pseudomassariella vexata]